MYGYQPPEQEPEGSWREALLIIRITFAAILPALGLIFGTLALLGALLWALVTNPLLALIPAAILAAGIMWLVRRDRELQREEEERINRL